MASRTIKIGKKKFEIDHNVVDRVIEHVAPAWGARRLKSRIAAAMLGGGYSGASKSKRALSGWDPGVGSADADTMPDLETLRARSRDLARNVPLATGVLHTQIINVVGTGLAMQSTIDRDYLGLDDEAAAAWQADTEREFCLWAESTNCDAAGLLSFYGLQALAFRSMLENGDCFAVLPQIPRAGTPYRLAVQLIEADRVSNPNHAADTQTLAGGLELNTYGERIAAHICSSHPGDYRRPSLKWDRITFRSPQGRRQLLHIIDPQRIGQTRGVPYLAPVIEILKQLGRYTENELMAAVVSGLFTVFIKSDGGDSLGGLAPDATATSNGTTGDGKSWNGELGNGLVVDLAPGESVETANPGRPSDKFDPFVQACIGQFAVGLGLPPEVVTKKFNSSYSAARAALLDAWRLFRYKREWFSEYFCQPIYERWLEEAVALGRVQAPGFLTDPMARRAWSMTAWTGDGPGSIDPVKEVDAAERRIKLGISTRARESLLHDGLPWDAKHKQLARESEARRADGLDIGPVAERIIAERPEDAPDAVPAVPAKEDE